VLISKGNTLACPVSICRHYVLLSKLNLNSDFYIIWPIYRHKGRYTWECVWYGNVNFRRFSMNIRVSKATSLKCVLFSSICIYQCACLSLFVCVCVPVAIYYFGFSVFIDKIKGTNKRRNLQTAIPNTVYPSLRQRVLTIIKV
jgi:hypothetical protein